MRFIKYTAAVLCLQLILSACALPHHPTATDLLAKLLTLPDTPPVAVYFDNAPKEEAGFLGERDGRELYGDHLPGDHAEQYALALSRDDSVFEIHLYYALDAEQADQIENILRDRQTVLQKKENYLYDPDSPAASSVIWRRGRWVALLVTDDNDHARDLLEKSI